MKDDDEGGGEGSDEGNFKLLRVFADRQTD